jgi:hypothetical protein
MFVLTFIHNGGDQKTERYCCHTVEKEKQEQDDAI